MSRLVAGIDSSTQSCKVEIRDLATGEVIREGKALHPAGTILDPDVWWDALLLAVERAGGLEDVAAVSVSGQQHTPVFLDASGALRWLRDTDPDAAERTAAVAVVHDWLTWRLMGFGPGNADFDMLITDRSEASGTGYWSGDTEEYCLDLFELALGRRAILAGAQADLEHQREVESGTHGGPVDRGDRHQG